VAQGVVIGRDCFGKPKLQNISLSMTTPCATTHTQLFYNLHK